MSDSFTPGRFLVGTSVVLIAALVIAFMIRAAAGPDSDSAPDPTTEQVGTIDASTTTSSQSRADSGPITISGETDVVIENLSISNPGGECVRVIGSSNVTVKDSTIGPCGDWAVFIDKSSGVTVQNSTIVDSKTGGIYAHSSTSVAVVGNAISHSGRNPIQFDKVTGADNRIDDNTISNSRAEDMISVYMSSGTSDSWLSVRGNTVRQNTGQSHSGSGIMVGDAGGSHTLVEGNRLTDPGQAGIGVAGGSNMRVLNNTVAANQFAWSNVGIYVWNQDDSDCHSIEVRGNEVNWTNSSGKSNPAWNGGGCGTVAGWDQNSW